eukprot:TRINITY_DN1576_c0_g1_i1.p1 TRINITY_DN1576_c0_g1~~TRINITY_DN1576_c0_g1_i1.p1  ORF type:complete len:103 (+),score=10.43 TRINITY_DN1576_c0_g1_i1:45-311(+)
MATVSNLPTPTANPVVTSTTTGNASLTALDGICIAVTTVVALSFFLGVLCLFTWHVTLVWRNSTTIDSYRDADTVAENEDHVRDVRCP